MNSTVTPAQIAELRSLIRDVPDFPQRGILFRDIAPILRHRLELALSAMQSQLAPEQWNEVDAIAGVDARGFILGAGLAARTGKGFVPIRKSGKLPPPYQQIEYQLEYGSGVLEMHRGEGRLLIVDDVLATGGTLRAAAELTEASGYNVAGLLVLMDLKLIPALTWREHAVRAVMECRG